VTPSDATTQVVAPHSARRAYLVVLAGDRMGEMFGLTAGTTAIGRGLQVEVRINDEGISRTHALIVQEGDVFYLSDAGSTNGTFVGGVKIDRYPLLEGDRIQLGATSVLKFTYRDDNEEDLQRRLYESALRDRPTGLFNNSYFQSRLEGRRRGGLATRSAARVGALRRRSPSMSAARSSA
jgi:two-component system cell cycle response regulator